MAEEFVVCSSCTLRHRVRAAGTCPRCGAVVGGASPASHPSGLADVYEPPPAAPAARPTASSTPRAPTGAAPRATAGAGARATTGVAEKGAKSQLSLEAGYRIAGAFFLANALASLFVRIRFASVEGASRAGLTTVIVSALYGFTLLLAPDGGGSKTRKGAPALFLLLAGLLLFLGAPLMAAMMVGVGLAVALVISGKFGMIGRLSGVVPLVAYLVFTVMAGAGQVWALESMHLMIGTIRGRAITVVQGAKLPYEISLPTSTRWFAAGGLLSSVSDDFDRAMFSPSWSGFVSVTTQDLPTGRIDFETVADAVLAELEKGSSSFELQKRDMILGNSRGILLQIRQTVTGSDLDTVFAILRKGTKLYLVHGAVPHGTSKTAMKEFRTMIERFVPAPSEDPPEKSYLTERPKPSPIQQYDRPIPRPR